MFFEVYLFVFMSGVEFLDLSVVIWYFFFSYVFFEFDNVGIWDDFGVGRGKNGCSFVMDGFNWSIWCCGSGGCEWENGVVFYDCG